MMHLLDCDAQPRLRAFAQGGGVVVFDFDGTLAPIVARREAAHMRLRTRFLLTRLCTLYPCAVVSGRATSDTAARLQGVPLRMLFGSHGMDPGPHLAHYREVIARVRAELQVRLAGYSWADIEDKETSLAVHYRKAMDKEEAHRRIVEAAGDFNARIRIIFGKFVCDFVPKDAPNKGDAVLTVQRNLNAGGVLYIGDDVTDEDVFQHAATRKWLCVRVGHSLQTKAPYYLRNQREIDALLLRMIRLRESSNRAEAACAE
jgi:trehalose 6-phosphate phosphatase